MIKRVFFLFLILSSLLLARNYDQTIIDIESKLFPKMALLEKRVEKSSSPYLNISIVANEMDFDVAQGFKTNIESSYPNAMLNKKIITKVIRFEDLKTQTPDAIIVLHDSKETLRAIASWANERKIVSFAYDPSYLEDGFLASIYIEKSTKPYLNAQVIKKFGFIFNTYLLRLSKFKTNGKQDVKE